MVGLRDGSLGIESSFDHEELNAHAELGQSLTSLGRAVVR